MSATPAQDKKRKQPPGADTDAAGNPSKARKPQSAPQYRQNQQAAKGGAANRRARNFNARTLATQSSDAALSNTGELNVAAYVAARAFEIRALEQGMVDSKNVNSQRAFQKVPRALRRRTASHDVKRVPKRLRKRATHEMHEDNTPTGKRRAKSRLQHIRLDKARRLKWLNVRYKARRKASKTALSAAELAPDADIASREAASVGLKPSEYFEIAPRVPKIKKNVLSHPSRPPGRYAKRQRDKTWLPTHLWHAKRAHMTSNTKWSHRRLGKVVKLSKGKKSKAGATMPGGKYCTGGVDGALWRFAIPLTPTMKCYRSIHRDIGMRGAVLWDASYMSTIGVQGTAEGIEGLLKAVSVEGPPAGARGKRWRNGSRAWEGWVYELHDAQDGDEENKDAPIRKPIAPVTIVWCAPEKEQPKPQGKGDEDVEMAEASAASSKKRKEKPKQRKLIIRVHPSAFLQLWTLLLSTNQARKQQVMLEDLRFDIGSIDIMGVGATEALLSALKPVIASDSSDDSSVEQTWTKLSPTLTNPASLPPGAVMGFNVSDPRLRFPPQPMRRTGLEKEQAFSGVDDELAQLLVSWPPDRAQGPADIFSRPKRLAAVRQMPSQKAINRRKAQAEPGEYPAPRETDPQIPILLIASRTPPSSCANQGDTTTTSTTNAARPAAGAYTILAPWHCIPALFRYLTSYPLSTGSTPSFAGLEQQRQVAFETGHAWFPGDFPGTKAGWEWGLKESAERKWEWEKRPKGRRVEFESLDLGCVGRGYGQWEDRVGGEKRGKRKGEIGEGWSCDWRRLIYGSDAGDGEVLKAQQETQPKEQDSDVEMKDDSAEGKKKEDSPEHTTPIPLPQDLYHLTPPLAGSRLSTHLQLPRTAKHPSTSSTPKTPSSALPGRPFATVRLSMLNNRGSPNPCARIYRLPTTDPALRECWMQTLRDQHALQTQKHKRNQARAPPENNITGTSSVSELDPINAGAVHLPMPEEQDLIGFVTTGNYNLRAGYGTAIGCVYVNRVLDGAAADPKLVSAGGVPGMAKEMLARACIVRNAGDVVGRFGFWEAV